MEIMIKKNVLVTIAIIAFVQLNGIENISGVTIDIWKGPGNKCRAFIGGRLVRDSYPEYEEREELEKKRLLDRKKLKSLKESSGLATIEKLLDQVSDEERINLLKTLPTDVVEYLMNLIDERKTLLDKTDASDLKKEEALINLQNLINSALN